MGCFPGPPAGHVAGWGWRHEGLATGVIYRVLLVSSKGVDVPTRVAIYSGFKLFERVVQDMFSCWLRWLLKKGKHDQDAS